MISSHRHSKHVLSERVSDRYAHLHAGTLQSRLHAGMLLQSSDLVRFSFFFDTFLVCLTFPCRQDAKTPRILCKGWREVSGQVPQNVAIYDTHTHIDRHGFS